MLPLSVYQMCQNDDLVFHKPLRGYCVTIHIIDKKARLMLFEHRIFKYRFMLECGIRHRPKDVLKVYELGTTRTEVCHRHSKSSS